MHTSEAHSMSSEPAANGDRLTNERDEKRTKERKRVILLVSNQLQHERVRVNSE